jgi:hypothetical protein
MRTPRPPVRLTWTFVGGTSSAMTWREGIWDLGWGAAAGRFLGAKAALAPSSSMLSTRWPKKFLIFFFFFRPQLLLKRRKRRLGRWVRVLVLLETPGKVSICDETTRSDNRDWIGVW